MGCPGGRIDGRSTTIDVSVTIAIDPEIVRSFIPDEERNADRVFAKRREER